MKLKDCKMGVIVRENIEKMYAEKHRPKEAQIGHIVGLVTNCTGEVIPVVKWACAEAMLKYHEENVSAIHHSNIEILREE